MTGALVLIVFAACAALMYRRILPALVAVPVMALATAALSGASWSDLASVLVDGTVKLAPVIAIVVFGALLSRVTLSTGIAETFVDYAAEFGGDRPIVLALSLSAVVAFLFTGLYGLGAIIMVGSIVLPIMLTTGVPRRTAATLFLLAYALGFIFNISQWGFYTKTFGVDRAQMQPFAYVLAGLDLVALVAFVAVRFRASRGSAAWALAVEDAPKRRAPPWALVTPLVPIALYYGAGVHPVVAFVCAALYGALATKPREAVATLVAAAIRGVEDVAPAVLLFMGIGMLLVATGLPSVKAALAPLVGAIAPRSAIAYVIVFGLLSPLALYRGPLNPFGVGIAVYTVLAGLGILPAAVLVAAVMAVVQVQNVCDPTNTQNVWVANFTGVGVDEIARLTLPFQVAVATAATLAVASFGTALLGTPPFGATNAAHAAELAAPGLLAPSGARFTIAVGTAPSSPDAAREAADETRREIGRGWAGFTALALDGDPAASDCAGKPYAAAMRFDATPASGATGATEIGLELVDCAGWPVQQWYANAAAPGGARAAALGLLVRVRTWMEEEPRVASALWQTGLAYDATAAKPTYFYSLFKTDDGQMRAYVRPGGPAYVAGLRTNDVVEKLDGKFWWEYGTYQTQARAYDGMPHAFVVQRGTVETTVALGLPYGG